MLPFCFINFPYLCRNNSKPVKMIYPENFEEKTGFTTIRSLVAKYILCDLGKKHLDQISFTTNAAELVQKLSQVNELAALLREGAGFPQQDYFDPTAELIRIKTPGTAIEPETLADLKISIQTILGIQEFLRKKEADKVKHLIEVVEPAYIDPSIPKEINRIIDENGHIRDNASSALKEIRNKLTRKKNETEQKMAAIFTRVKKEGFTVENLEVSIRNGRQVIPVPAAFKRQIKGFVHDESATGQTVYIEPAEIFEINNEIRELENAERREIFRILMFFADFLRPHLPMLLQSYQVLGQIDFIRAKARLALEINGIMPFVKDEAVIEWQNAIHPLLFLVHQKQKKTVVPLNLSLNADQRILLISGPNAGGKSVALKTTGLLQYMLQCGLLIPVSENSTAGIFHHLFIDIGDQQSLEKDLSTYTSHLKNLRHFSKHANERSLLLIDEFGTGTEPQLGGAIAEAVMEHLAEKKSFGIITTHYANLKEAAHRIPGIINGAMLFDPDNLSPLFVLKTGKPGSSYAFEIAEKIGFPKELLKRARKKINRSAFDYDKMLQELEVEKIALHEKQQSVNVADEFLKELIEKYNLLNKDLHSQKKRLSPRQKRKPHSLFNNRTSWLKTPSGK
jgi:DNA mismatch repair protein MutS2